MKSGNLLGIITDGGSLRRMLEKGAHAGGHHRFGDHMTTSPKTIDEESLAVEALDLMRKHDITQLVVTSGQKYLGFIHLHDLIREGII